MKFLRPLRDLSISTKLIAGFTAISIVAVLVGVTGLYFIDKINSTLNNITDIAAPTVETSDDLIALIFEATKVAEEIIADEDIEEIEELVVELKGLEAEFHGTYRELQGLVTDESLLDELETAKTEQFEFSENAEQMVAAHRLEIYKETQAFALLVDFDAAGSQLTEALDEFAVENEAEMAKAEELGDTLAEAGSGGEEVNRVLGQLFDQDYPVVEAALKLQRIVAAMQDTAGEYLAEETAPALDRIEADFAELEEAGKPHLEVLKVLAESDEDREDASDLEHMLENWAALARGKGQLFDIHRQKLAAEFQADNFAELLEIDTDNAAAALDKVAETADAISDGADEAAAQAVDQARTAILSLLILALFGSVALLVMIGMTVVRPIKLLTKDMAVLAERYGSVLKVEKDSGDEVARLGAAFTHLASQVKQRTAELQQRTLELDDANRDLEQELERRQSLEEQLVHAQKLDSLGTLAGGIAHDFNNMLYVITGCTKMAIAETPTDSLLGELLTKIDQAAQRSKSIVNQILFFSRHETPDRKPLDVANAVRESVTLLRAGLPSSMIMDVACEENCGTVLADETQIQQLAVNLATNGYQAHADRKGTISLTVDQVDVDEAFASQHLNLNHGPHVRISVKDQGCGIPAEILPKIYDPFFTTKPVGEGTGLGLAVVHGIVASHDGTVVISTKVDHGTTFEVYFPIWEESMEDQEVERQVNG